MTLNALGSPAHRPATRESFFVAEVALPRVKSEGGRWEVMPPTFLLEGGDERK